jgi:hypothetical protein
MALIALVSTHRKLNITEPAIFEIPARNVNAMQSDSGQQSRKRRQANSINQLDQRSLSDRPPSLSDAGCV